MILYFPTPLFKGSPPLVGARPLPPRMGRWAARMRQAEVIVIMTIMIIIIINDTLYYYH